MVDYIIVGGGSAGCVLANRLSANPATRVCLLEAGPPDTSPFIRLPLGIVHLMMSKKLNWQYFTEPQANLDGRRLFWPRGKTLGGSSSSNAMIYTRGHPSDYDHWAALGNRGWSYADVLPLFRRSEHREGRACKFHGAGGALNVAPLRSPNLLSRAFFDAAQQAGYQFNADFNGAEQEGVNCYEVTQKNGERWSAARAFLHPVLKRPNLHRRLARGRRVDHADSGGRQYQCAGHHDRRKSRGYDLGRRTAKMGSGPQDQTPLMPAPFYLCRPRNKKGRPRRPSITT